MKVSIASDHAGFEQKEALAAYLVERGFDVVDRGPATDDRVDYPDFALPVALDVARGLSERGVLVCGTGIGMALAADKVAGVRAANIVSVKFAELCRDTTMRMSSRCRDVSLTLRRTSASWTRSSRPISPADAMPAASRRS